MKDTKKQYYFSSYTYVVSAGEGEKPSLSMTKHPMPSPLTSWGNPTTAASDTSAQATSALSTSAVPIRWPDGLMTSSTRPDEEEEEDDDDDDDDDIDIDNSNYDYDIDDNHDSFPRC